MLRRRRSRQNRGLFAKVGFFGWRGEAADRSGSSDEHRSRKAGPFCLLRRSLRTSEIYVLQCLVTHIALPRLCVEYISRFRAFEYFPWIERESDRFLCHSRLEMFLNAT